MWIDYGTGTRYSPNAVERVWICLDTFFFPGGSSNDLGKTMVKIDFEMECPPILDNLFLAWHSVRFLSSWDFPMFVHHCCAVWFGDWPDLFIICIQHGDDDYDDDDDDDDDTGHPTPVWAIPTLRTLFSLLCHFYHFSYLPRCVGKIVSMPTQWDLFDAGTWTQNIASHIPTLLRRSFSAWTIPAVVQFDGVLGPRYWFLCHMHWV